MLQNNSYCFAQKTLPVKKITLLSHVKFGQNFFSTITVDAILLTFLHELFSEEIRVSPFANLFIFVSFTLLSVGWGGR